MPDDSKYEFRTYIGQNNVLTSGIAIVYDKEELIISFLIGSYIIKFVDGDHTDVDISLEGNGLKYIIRNALNPLGTVFGFPAGLYDGREAELRLTVTGFVSGDQPPVRLVSYCLTVPKAVQ